MLADATSMQAHIENGPCEQNACKGHSLCQRKRGSETMSKGSKQPKPATKPGIARKIISYA